MMFGRAPRFVASSNGVQVVVYDEPSIAPGGAAPILFSHATGFHGRVFAPVAAHLAEHSRTTFDYRGYGDTRAPANWPLSWDGFGDDALAVAHDVVARNGGRPVIGVGHSMGGTGLVMAALREPQLFAALVIFEPIIFPPEMRTQASGSNPLAASARRRRRAFASHDDAVANFAAKPPLSSLHPDALAAYVRHGFTQQDDGVHIKCDPEFEAQTYEMGATHNTWLHLGDLRTPTWVMAGAHAEFSPAAIAPQIAERIPGCTFVRWADLGHFGPLDDPARFASFIREVTTALAGN